MIAIMRTEFMTLLGFNGQVIPLALENNLFIKHMMNKGRLSETIQKIPVFAIKEHVEVSMDIF